MPWAYACCELLLSVRWASFLRTCGVAAERPAERGHAGQRNTPPDGMPSRPGPARPGLLGPPLSGVDRSQCGAQGPGPPGNTPVKSISGAPAHLWGIRATQKTQVDRMESTRTEMVIVGGGICGLLAARQCRDRGMSYVLIEQESSLGGNWVTKANEHSQLQVGEGLGPGLGPGWDARRISTPQSPWPRRPDTALAIAVAHAVSAHPHLHRTCHRRTSLCTDGTTGTVCTRRSLEKPRRSRYGAGPGRSARPSWPICRPSASSMSSRIPLVMTLHTGSQAA